MIAHNRGTRKGYSGKREKCADHAGAERAVICGRTKTALNLKKHGVRFETAAMVFCDEYRIELYDAEHSADEDRYNTIGMVDNILFVVYTERKNRIRLISARPANSKERSLYYDRYL